MKAIVLYLSIVACCNYVLLLVYTFQGEAKICPKMCNCGGRYVSCKGKNLKQIPKNISVWTTNLDLSYNVITELPRHSFAFLLDLYHLNLDCNQIFSIDDHAFANLSKLHFLNLTHNNISYIDGILFRDTTSLKSLHLKYNSLTTIPEVANLINLEFLDLSNNHISRAYFPPLYENLTAIDTIVLSNNNIGIISTEDLIHLAEKLKHFFCINCKIKQVKGNIFSKFTSLKGVDFSRNQFPLKQLKLLMNSFSACQELENLTLNEVIYKYSLPRYFFKIIENVTLKYLSLSNLKRYGILKNYTFSSLQSLTELNLEHSKFISIQLHAFEGLPELQKLLLSYAGVSFESYPMLGAFFPNNLRILSLSGNWINHVKPKAFSNLHLLHTLKLRHCNLYSFSSSSFPVLNNLHTLELSSNNLYDVKQFNSSTFSRLGNITRLNLFSNDLNQIINVAKEWTLLKHLKKLKYLQMSLCQLETLPVNFFKNQAQLYELKLNRNNLKTWDADLFKPIQRLEHLFLKHNKIQTITNESTKYWKMLRKLSINDNPINCWCELIWFLKWLQQAKKRIMFLKEATCESPSIYHNTKLVKINIDELYHFCSPLSWIVYVAAASASTFTIILLAVFIVIRFQWYLKWYCYRCWRKGFLYDSDQASFATCAYEIFVSYHTNEEQWVDSFVVKLETGNIPNNLFTIYDRHSDSDSLDAVQCLNSNKHSQETRNFPNTNNIRNIDDSQQVGLSDDDEQKSYDKFHDSMGEETNISEITALVEESTGNALSRYKFRRQVKNRHILTRRENDTVNNHVVYYEKRCLPNKSRFEESARAIYNCKQVIIVLSAAYLKDKRLQFELDLIQTAMTERYGYGAFNHLIFTTAEPTGELMHWLPQQLRGIVDKSCILWSETNIMQQTYFWEKIMNSLTQSQTDD